MVISRGPDTHHDFLRRRRARRLRALLAIGAALLWAILVLILGY
jgi:hypothetical protein